MTRKVVRAADLAPPRPISDDDFDLICRTTAILTDQRAAAREVLDEAVKVFGEYIRGERKLPNRKADRHAIDRAIKDLRRAQYRVNSKVGSAGEAGLRAAGRRIGPVISASWIRHRFAGDSAAPQPIYWPEQGRDLPLRAPIRTADIRQPTDPEELSLDQRIRFMEQRGGAAVAALLADIAGALESGRRAIVLLPGGRKPLERRAYMLAALAQLWHRLGRRPTSGDKSKFGEFCEAVFDAIGWPTEGVNSALLEAIELWRRIYRR